MTEASRSAFARSGAWAALLGLSLALGFLFETIRLPAALFMGPLLAAIGLAATGVRLRVPARPYYAGQALLGCLIAGYIPASIFGELQSQWPLFLSGVLSVIVAGAVLGWLLARWRVLPGSCAVWGVSPGAATAMVLMAEAYGEDFRLVAVMQYLRVVCAVTVASLMARLWGGGTALADPSAIVWFPPVDVIALLETLLLAGACAIIGRVLRIPAGPLLLPLALGALLQDAGLIRLELPPWLMPVSYALVGWTIGLRFDRAILRHAWHALPRIFASIMVLILVCAAFAVILVRWAGVDPLSAYLATSPGGADTVAIIAASTKVDVPFIMAMQTARLALVILLSPRIARFVAGHMRARRSTAL